MRSVGDAWSIVLNSPSVAEGELMTRYETAIEAVMVAGAIRRSDEPGALVSTALSQILGSELFTGEEIAKLRSFADAIQRMNNRDFADEIADEFLALLSEIEPGSGLRQ